MQSSPEEDLEPILCEEVEIAVAALKKESLPELIIYQQNLFKLAGKLLLMFQQRHPCLTPTVVLNHSPVLLLT